MCVSNAAQQDRPSYLSHTLYASARDATDAREATDATDARDSRDTTYGTDATDSREAGDAREAREARDAMKPGLNADMQICGPRMWRDLRCTTGPAQLPAARLRRRALKFV